MSVMKRIANNITAKINAMLDNLEDPVEMSAQCVRDAIEDKSKLRHQLGKMIADLTACNRELETINREIEADTAGAEAAVRAGNDNDARVFLRDKAQLGQRLVYLIERTARAAENVDQIKKNYTKVCSDIMTYESRRDEIRAISNASEAQETVNSITLKLSQSSISGDMDRYTTKVYAKADAVDAEYELITEEPVIKLAELKACYSIGESDIEEELSKIKVKLSNQIIDEK